MIIIKLIFALIIFEIIVFLFINYIRKKNQWLIINKDKKPVFYKTTLDKILLKSYDSLLGWDRKPNTTGSEKGKIGITKWNVNNFGVRDNLEFNEQKSHISLFGDSFTFAREVNDNKTWAYKLSQLTQSNVQNFGVGNFGFDQALIKLEHKLKSKKIEPNIVMIGVVPDTISRILSTWKHYYEYGNIFGFKPRYILVNNEIKLISNTIDNKNKFYDIESYLPKIQENDFFYKNKFLKEIITFPYSFSFIKNFRRNFILTTELFKNGMITKPTNFIMKENFNFRLKLYKDKANIDLLVEELKLFKNLSDKYNFKAYFVIMPQKDDLNYIKDTHIHFYQKLVDRVPTSVTCIDTLKYLKNYSSKEVDELYSDDSEYGGHFSNKGNDVIANIVYNEIGKRSNDEKNL